MQHRPRRPLWLMALGVLGVLCVFVVILFVPVYATSASSYCGRCHEMRVAYRSWERSAHSDVQCIQCHVPEGAGAALKWRAKETRNIWAAYLNMDPVNEREPRPANENCIKCHPLEGLMGIAGQIRMPHARHINQNNLKCIDCHDHTAHAAPGQSSDVSMRPCTMCHEQTNDPTQCSFCHYAKPEGTTHPTDFIVEHGKLAAADETDCLRCHHDKAQFCDRCHAKPPPGHYADKWRYTHGQQAAKDRDLCLGCHSYETLCRQCHEVSHPDDWTQAHAAAAVKGDASCLVCHPPAMCDKCHREVGVQTL